MSKQNDFDFPPLGAAPKGRGKKPQSQPPIQYTKTTTTTTTTSAPSSMASLIAPQSTSSSTPSTPTTTTPTTSTTTKDSSSFEIVDIGANLADKSFDKDIKEILERGYKKGVKKIVITGTSKNSSTKAIELIEWNKRNHGVVELFSTVGVHPHEAERALQGGADKIINELTRIITKNRATVKAVGECGLDFNRNFSSHETQIEMFDRQIQLGIDLNLPLFIHERESYSKFIEVVSKYTSAGKMPTSVVHCFTGTEKEAIEYVKLGFYISFAGTITQDKRGHDLREILKKKIIPIDKIMIETDCPYMTPHNIPAADKPKNNTGRFIRNEPQFLTCILKTLAECYQVTEEEMASQTLNNTKKFFSI
ncbi:hypothetical protein CYY_004065 [Polysphondylium violaceum]|uniref:Uncharacterized protein n=1 Tax=Polysphondylium violaceum TaxID=133409 RepID=A0A8J4UT98_9MYCE|nr:hypothetical protein CYY_004065 [Polysphondylium violaceum]